MTAAERKKADIPTPQGDRIEALEAKIDKLTDHISLLADNQRRQKELFDEMMPIAREAMGVMSDRLEEIDRRGYFDFGNEIFGVVDQVVTNYSPEDVQDFGDNVVFILDAVRSVTQPDMMELAYEASVAIREAETDEAKSLWGMFKESKDDDIRRGMAVMLEVLRHIGKTAKRSSDNKHSSNNKRLEAVAPKKCRPKPPSASPQKQSTQKRPTQPPQARTAPASPPPVQTEPGDGEAAVYIDGVGFDSEGFMLDNDEWTKELGTKVAAALGLAELEEDHWKVIDFARSDYEENETSPNIRRITKHSGVSTRELYQLFPQAPGVMVSQIAGIPKPKGCI